jgi:hypothetical protein
VNNGFNGQSYNFNNYYSDEDYGDEAEDNLNLDDNGQIIPSPEEIKNIINSIPSFKYEEKKQNSTKQ